jgi:hypothetical protein
MSRFLLESLARAVRDNENIAAALERAARPVLVVPASERLTAWPPLLPGTRVAVANPAAVVVLPGTAPPWDAARRLVEDDDP